VVIIRAVNENWMCEAITRVHKMQYEMNKQGLGRGGEIALLLLAR